MQSRQREIWLVIESRYSQPNTKFHYMHWAENAAETTKSIEIWYDITKASHSYSLS